MKALAAGAIPQWQNYVNAFTFVPFGRFMFNSCYITVIVVVAQVLVASLAAFAVARLEFRGKDLLFGLFLSVLTIPFLVKLIPNFLLMKQFGWLDSHLSP